MSTVLTEYVFEYALRFGLDYVYNNQSVLEKIFSQFSDDFLLARYGQDHLDNVKKFLNENKVEIYHAWKLDQFKTPSYTVQLASEGEVYKALGDDHPMEVEDYPADDIATNINILSYDANTGYLDIDLASDISDLSTGHYIVDSNSDSFEITGAIIIRPTEQKIFIGRNLVPEPAAGIGKATTGEQKKQIKFGSIRMNNTVNIGIHHTEPHIVRYLYYIALYIFNRWKSDLFEQRGVELSTYSATDTIRVQEMVPNNVFSRILTVNCFTEMTWDEGESIVGSTLFASRLGVDNQDETEVPNPDSLDANICLQDFST